MNATSPRAALGWLAGRWFRQRWLAAVPLALIVAVGGTGTMIAVGAADRTSSAYGDYLEHADVGDLVINPSLNTRQIGEVIRDLPNVEQVTSDMMLGATFDDGRPRPRFEVEETDYQSFTFGSHDGRYFEMDRPIVVEGRMPTGPNEAAATVESAATDGFGVGDVVSLSFWP